MAKGDKVCPFSHKSCVFCGLYRARHYFMPYCDAHRHNNHKAIRTRSPYIHEARQLSNLPKLRMEPPNNGDTEATYDLQQAKTNLFNYGALVMVEGQLVQSYDELVRLAEHEHYRNKEFLNARVLPMVGGG